METVTVATKSDLLTNLNKQTDEIIISGALAQEEQKIEHAILRLYVIKKLTPETTLLRLKQLDY